MRNKQVVALGGTFDHFHAGHEHFLSFAAGLGKKLLIGVTDENLVKHKAFSKSIESLNKRKRSVEQFCRKNSIEAEIITLYDVFGSTLDRNDIRYLAVTQETVKGAEKINEVRQASGKSLIPIRITDWLRDENDEILSSTRIRAGLVNRNGVVYTNALRQDIVLKEKQRAFFSKVQGKLVSVDSVANTDFTAVVGDETLEQFLENDLSYQLAIFDKKRMRENFHSELIEKLKIDKKVENIAGHISVQLTEVLQNAVENKYKHIFVDGEEDLATVALVLVLPLQSKIYYGQPHKGLVEIIVSEEIKNRFLGIVRA